MFQPVIKWSGSKRSQCYEIIKNFPLAINTYYEPFIGGGSVLRALLDSNIKVKEFICSDINIDLINLWNCIKSSPDNLLRDYENLWKELNIDTDYERKKQYFYSVRDRYNKNHMPSDFLFVMRTTTNGMPRYNRNGEFNNSFHVTRDGINPIRFGKVLSEWSALLNKFGVTFLAYSYEIIKSNDGDVLYLDPPYFATKGMYYGCIDYDNFWKWLKIQKGKYFLSFDGKVNKEDFTYSVPEDLYRQHLYLDSGNSSFRRVVGNSKDSYVYESLYIK